MSAAPRTPARAPGRLWVGPAGWSYPDWEGVVYPRRRPAGFHPLTYLARFVSAVEVNSSFYALPSPRNTEAWVRRVPAQFRFTFKLTRSFTHERATFPPRAEVEAFLDALRPVRDAGRLGPVLIQFPWSFRFDPAAEAWLARLSDEFAQVERVIEVRHASWAQPEALAALARAGGYCNIDQPALRDCLPPTAHAFGRNAYVRLHGRNAANWFAEGLPGFERYNYLYGEAELREWVRRIEALRGQAEEVYVVANNHYRGQGVVNALELRALLDGGRYEIPAELQAAFPRLASLAAAPRQATLFD
jgi:uncharacterized protein YecE (DUF72 family)